MKKLIVLALCSGLFFTSCVSKKKYAELESKQERTQDLLNTATVKLNDCLEERSGLFRKFTGKRFNHPQITRCPYT